MSLREETTTFREANILWFELCGVEKCKRKNFPDFLCRQFFLPLQIVGAGS